MPMVINLTPTAQFVLTVTKAGTGSGTVTSSPAGINCGATCTASFTQGQSVTLTGSTTSGSTFTGWSGACSGTGACTVSMTQSRSVTATFTLNQPLPTVTITATDSSAAEAPLNTGTFTVSRTGSTTTALNVIYTVGGSATAGSDYTALVGSVSIPAGQASAPILVTPINDSLVENAETVLVTVSPNAAYTVGSPGSATVTITSDDGSTVIFQDNMENGPGNWFPSSPWALTTSAAYSPTHAWTDSPGGNYGNNANVALWSPVLNFSGLSVVTLSFRHRYDLEDTFDFGRVWVTTDNGLTFTQMASYTGVNTNWTQATINLSAFAGQPSVRIVFQLVSDGSATRDGWYIDDVLVTR